MPDRDTDRTSGHRTARNSAFAMLALVFYILGIGPAAWLYLQIDPGPAADALEMFYKPLLLLNEHGIEPFSELLLWYTGIWEDL